MAEQLPSDKPKIIFTVELEGPRPNIHVVESVYKGPVLNLIYLDGFGSKLSFGPGKAKMLLHCIPEIRAFYDKTKDKLAD